MIVSGAPALPRTSWPDDVETGPLRALGRLDRRLAGALDAAAARDGSAPLLPADCERADAAAWAASAAAEWDDICDAEPLWAWLRDAFGLSAFDLDVVLIALAPELDARYERAYAYLQDDARRTLPGVGLVLELCCPTLADRTALRAHLGTDGPLLRHRLVTLLPDPHPSAPTLLRHSVKLDDQVVNLLLGQGGLDHRLAPFAVLQWTARALDDPALPASVRDLRDHWRQAYADGSPLRCYLHGPDRSAARTVAEAIAADVGRRLLHADVPRLLALGGVVEGTAGGPTVEAVERACALLLREARLQDAVLHLDGIDQLFATPPAVESLARLLADDGRVVLLSGADHWPGTATPVLLLDAPLPPPDGAQRSALWQAALASNGQEIGADDLESLAARFRLTPTQIANAALLVRHREPTIGALQAAARAQAGAELAGLAHRLTTRHTWDDLVLPPDALALLREICQRVAYQQRVLEGWGFGRKLSLGRGVSALFSGPSGTGKTLAAEVIAHALGLDLYRIDLSTVVSKYIGETERNLERVFSAAENANVILFFDEADAIFGRRSEVRDSHDRYANLEISYLLQRMEQYEGLAILATNLRENLDPAFVRRLHAIVTFPLPDEAQRRQLWRNHLPAEAPYDGDLDLGHLAARFRLSGGAIKNVTLAAAFLAAADDAPIGMAHLLRAVQREHQKMGRVLSDADLAWGVAGAVTGNGTASHA